MTLAKNRREARRKTATDLHLYLEPIKPLTENQKRVLAYDGNQVLHGCAGSGKAQPGYSKIKVPTGWTTMKDIMVGDDVITPNNTISKVINKFHHKNKDIYRIYLHDGRTVDACDEHLWKFETERKTFIAQTKDIPDLLLKNRNRLYIPLTEPIIDSQDKVHNIHPYIIGALIGDGSLTVKNRAVLSSADSFIVNKIASLLPDECTIRKVPSSNYEYTIVSKILSSTKDSNVVVNELNTLGLMGKNSYCKSIPPQYMSGSLNNKLSLLQGLFDTDGTVDTKNSIEFSTTSKLLSEQVAELIYSLGGTCAIKSRMGNCNGKDTVINYRIRPGKLPLSIKRELFSLPRKRDRLSAGQYDNSKNNKINKIEYIGSMECWCISIDSEDRLYLTDNYVITHNTFLSSYLAYKDLTNKSFGKVIYIRSAVATRDIGFLPGTEAEKVAVYELPYKDIANELFDRGGTYDDMKKKGIVEFLTTSHVRGITINDAVVIVDEIQNMSFHELDSIITRYGTDCKYFFCGDFRQSDLKLNGIKEFLKILKSMPDDFQFTDFTEEDIVRSGLVKRYIIARNKHEEGGTK